MNKLITTLLKTHLEQWRIYNDPLPYDHSEVRSIREESMELKNNLTSDV